jgi:hypothetical protein
MFLATGESKYIDVCERALYNNVLSGVSLSGDRFFYDNPLESSGEHGRQRWFGCACCPGNVTRFVASVPGYVYALSKGVKGSEKGVNGSERDVTPAVYVNLYVQGTAKIGKVELEQETDYPWDGRVKIRVTKGGGKFAMKLRVPSWLKTSPTNNNLYAYIDKAKTYSISVNGQALYPENRDYITISRSWKKGDEVILDMPMDVRRIVANDNAEDLRGKVALERGPVVFCLEGKDQKDNTVFNKYILNSTEITSRFEKDLLGGVVVLEGKAKELDVVGNASLRCSHDIEVRDVTFRAIPYSTWNNRGQQQMEVWVANSPVTAYPTPLETIASRAMTFSNRGPIQNDAPETAPTDGWAGGVNDQWEPRRSSDNSKPYHYWWLKRGTKESIAYKFDHPYEVSNVMVYWLDLDHYDGSFRTPESWTLYYKNDAGEWLEVEQHSPYTVNKDCYNSVDFHPVTTQELKIVAQLRQGQSGGVLEWKVNYGKPIE